MMTLNGRTSRADKPVPEAVRLVAEAQHARWDAAVAAKAELPSEYTTRIESGEVVLQPFAYMPKGKSKRQIRQRNYRS